MLKKHGMRMMNVGLRLATLVTKLGLTLYMGRYLSLRDIGVFGLAFGVVMTGGCFLGIRYDYIVTRELVGATPIEAIRKMRDQAAFYGLNYLVAGVCALLLYFSGQGGISGLALLLIFIIMVSDNFANYTYNNMNSLGQQIMANVLFFIRGGAWVVPAIALGLFSSQFRTVETILACWTCGILACIAGNIWYWRNLPWHELKHIPVDWTVIKQGVKKCFLIWLGTLGLAGGVYVDRFVVNHYLGLEQVGIATFYFSFANSLFTLVQSGVLTFAYPRMIAFHKEGNEIKFWHEVKQAFWHVSLFAGVMALGVGIGVPLLGEILHRQEFVTEALTLWLMLVAVWIRSNAETLYYVLFARHQDRAIWLGNLLFLIPAFGCNALLVPITGLSGIGYGALIAFSSLFLWRWWYVRHFPTAQTA